MRLIQTMALTLAIISGVAMGLMALPQAQANDTPPCCAHCPCTEKCPCCSEHGCKR